jgi:hypothetical protein
MGADRIDAVSRHPAVCHVYQPFTGYGMFEVTEQVAREFEEKTFARAREDITTWQASRGGVSVVDSADAGSSSVEGGASSSSKSSV